jgi:hypothetical protein
MKVRLDCTGSQWSALTCSLPGSLLLVYLSAQPFLPVLQHHMLKKWMAINLCIILYVSILCVTYIWILEPKISVLKENLNKYVQSMYVQGIKKGSYMHHPATEDKTMCSKYVLKEIFVFPWHVSIQRKSDMVVWTKHWWTTKLGYRSKHVNRFLWTW